MMVDISETKSMWYGESEKRIKKIFDTYRGYLKTCDIAPILLFNEADAVIGKRKEAGQGSIDQTENAIQNILLQEMENLEGIMIAAYATGAQNGYFYIRAEYPLAIKRIKLAIEKAKEIGLIGKNIFGSNFNFEAEVRTGAGAFVCGEEIH